MKSLMSWFRSRGGIGYYHEARRYMEKNRYKEAIYDFTKAQRLLEQEYGPDDHMVLEAISYQAYCLVKIGRANEAVLLYEHVVSAENRRHGHSSWYTRLNEHLAWARQRAREH